MKQPLNRYFDHTILKPEATSEDIRRLCREAVAGGFYSVCVNSCYVETAREILRQEESAAEASAEPVKIAAVVGFPLGACATAVKAFETSLACEKGASEVDMVLPVGALKEGRDDYVRADIGAVTEAAAAAGAIVKVILETCLLTDEEISRGCRLAAEAGAAFVKTSTGFSSGGAKAAHIRLMKAAAGPKVLVKASGGIRTLKDVLEMIEAGADRIGASASVQIMKEYNVGQES